MNPDDNDDNDEEYEDFDEGAQAAEDQEPSGAPDTAVPSDVIFDEVWKLPEFDERKKESFQTSLPAFKNLNLNEEKDPLNVFLACLPMEYFQSTLIPATNEVLGPDRQVDLGELLRWLGVTLMICSYVGCSRDEFWKRPIDEFDVCAYVGGIMSKARYEAIRGGNSNQYGILVVLSSWIAPFANCKPSSN